MLYRYSVSPVDELKCYWWNLYYSWVSLVSGILPKLWHWYNDIFLLFLYLWAAPPFPRCIELWESQPFPHLVRGTKMKLHKLKTSKSPCFIHAGSRSLTSQTLLPLCFSYKDNLTFLLYPITFKCEHTTRSKPALKLCTLWMWHTADVEVEINHNWPQNPIYRYNFLVVHWSTLYFQYETTTTN